MLFSSWFPPAEAQKSPCLTTVPVLPRAHLAYTAALVPDTAGRQREAADRDRVRARQGHPQQPDPGQAGARSGREAEREGHWRPACPQGPQGSSRRRKTCGQEIEEPRGARLVVRGTGRKCGRALR